MARNSLNLETAKVGEGATICFYTDNQAHTIIKKTAKTITLQRDKVTLLTKPNIEVGGFAGHCTNNEDLKYKYEPNQDGVKVVAYWSEAKQKYQALGGMTVIEGRHEYYDYNF